MSARNYLKYLQSKVPVQPGLVEEYKRVSAEFERAGDVAVSDLNKSGHLGSLDIAFGALPTFDGNAWAIKSPSGGFVVCIDYLLPTVLRMISRTIVEALACADDLDRFSSCQLNHTRGIWLAVKWFVERDLKYHRAWVAWQNSLEELPQELHAVYNGLAGSQLDFIIMHELHHILCGHLEKSTSMAFSADGNKSNVHSIHVLNRTHEQEIEADVEAAKFFTNNAAGVSVGAFASCEPFFVFLKTLEDSYEIQDLESSHPNATKRLHAIRRGYDSCTGGIQGFGKKLRLVVDSYFDVAFDIANIYKDDEALLFNQGELENKEKKYVDSVINGGDLTYVTVKGSLGKKALENIAGSANALLQKGEFVLTYQSIDKENIIEYPDDYISKNILKAISCVCAVLVCIWVIRKQEYPDKDLEKHILEKYVADLFENQDVSKHIAWSVESFVENNLGYGDLCKMQMNDAHNDCSVNLDIETNSANFFINIS